MSLRCEMSRERKLKLSLVESSNKANIFLGLIEYELNSLLGASHLVDYISVHIRFDLERYLLIVLSLSYLINLALVVSLGMFKSFKCSLERISISQTTSTVK